MFRPQLADIAPIFNLIQLGAEEGCFSNLYLRPNYQAGLALQLFSIRLFGKFRLPDGKWWRARLEVLRSDGEFAGFILTRSRSLCEQRQEIYMCAVAPRFRRGGKGRRMIRHALDQMPGGCEIEAHCLPSAMAMRRLLVDLGFRSARPSRQCDTGFIAETLRATIPQAVHRQV